MKAVVQWNALDSYFNFEEEEEVAALAAIHKSLAEKKRPRSPQPPEAAGAIEEEEQKKHKTTNVPPKKQGPPALRVEEIEQHNYRDNQLALFALNGSNNGKGSVNAVINKPPQVDVLAYCAQYRSEMPWYLSMQSYIASAADAYDYPDVPVMSRAMLCDFLRAPKNKGERPCINLDREPCEGEQRMRCEAHRLGGFRLRELILGDTLTRVNEAIAKKQDYSGILDTVPDMCYLCHLWTYLKNSIYQRDKRSAGGEKVVIINRFMVIVDQPGEYDRNKILMSEKVRAGLWGPVPLYNRNNYIVHHKEQRIEESANLLFRLTRAPLPLTDASKQKASNPSTPTNATPSSSGSLRP
jgi:hypothetical protein